MCDDLKSKMAVTIVNCFNIGLNGKWFEYVILVKFKQIEVKL